MPTFISPDNVEIDTILDSNISYLGIGLLEQVHNQYIYCCIIIAPVSTLLTSFCSEKEFIKVLQHIVSDKCFELILLPHLLLAAAYKYLCKELKILYCDISIGNILLYHPQ